MSENGSAVLYNNDLENFTSDFGDTFRYAQCFKANCCVIVFLRWINQRYVFLFYFPLKVTDYDYNAWY